MEDLKQRVGNFIYKLLNDGALHRPINNASGQIVGSQGKKFISKDLLEAYHLIKTLSEQNEKLREGLKWYTHDTINHHNYHATMQTDLTKTARNTLKELEDL
jgi:hypothetical protein